MDTNDRRAIEALFDKLAAVQRQAAPRDPEAEAFIREEIGRQPGAPYYMAQTIVMQEQALENAQRRIEELESRGRSQSQTGGSGSFFGNDPGQSRRPAGAVPSTGGGSGAGYGKWGSGARTDYDRSGARRGGFGGGGGGFLAGAAQTAMGVAGGVLLGNAIAGMFGGNEAQAADAAPENAADNNQDQAQDEAQVEDASFDDGGGFDDGGDFGEV